MTRISLLALALLVAAGCNGGKPPPGRQAGPQQVEAMVAAPERVERVVELTGTLGGAEEVTVAAEVDGRVRQVLADLGDTVDAGAPLLALDAAELRFKVEQAESDYLQSLARLGIDSRSLDRFDPETQADVRRAEADRAEAARNHDRGAELAKRGLLAEGELDTLATRARVADAAHQKALEDARSNFALAKGRRASLGLARKKLADATIASPVKGAVAKRMVALGDYVKAGQPVAIVVVTNPLKMHGEAPDRYAGQIRPGMPVQVELDQGGTFTGEVSRVGPLVSATSHTFPVEGLFPNADGALQPGLFARATIRIGADEEVYAIPETAISQIAGVNKIFVVKDGKAEVRPITILRKRGGDALLQGELRAGERVVLTGIARMHEGAQVQVTNEAEKASAPGSAR